MAKIYILPIWCCTVCNYHQDYDPTDEKKMARFKPHIPIGHCAPCFREGKMHTMQLETREYFMLHRRVLDEAEAETVFESKMKRAPTPEERTKIRERLKFIHDELKEKTNTIREE